MPEYSNLFVTVTGMGTVFFGLFCIVIITRLMSRILNPDLGKGNAAAMPVSEPLPPSPDGAVSAEIAAVIMAALAEELGDQASQMKITAIQRT